MNYLCAILGIALLAAITSAAVFRGNAAEWHQKYDDRVNQEQTAAQQAKDDAAATEARDLAALKSQSSQAILKAQSGQEQAQQQLTAYLARGRASGGKDLSHECFNVPIAPELLPGAK